MLSLDEHRRADGLCTPINHPALLFLRTRCQQQVQLCQIQDLRHRYQIVTPELTSFAFHAAFLMPLARRAELRFEPPVRTERDKSRRLFPLMTPAEFSLPHSSGCRNAAPGTRRQNRQTQVRALPGRLVGWRADRLDEMHPRPPCCVSKKGWSCAMCHQTPPSLHTNPPALRHPMCTTAPRRFPAPVDPWPPFLPAHTVAPLIRPHPLRASRGAVVCHSVAQSVAAFWEPCGRTPESHR